MLLAHCFDKIVIPNDNLYHYLTFFLQNMDWRCPVLWKLGSLSIECWLSFCLQVQENHPCKLKLTNCEDRASASKICYQLQVHRGSNFPLQVDKKADILSISLSFELQQMANAGEMSALLYLFTVEIWPFWFQFPSNVALHFLI